MVLLAEMKDLSERTGELESEIDFLVAERARAEQEHACLVEHRGQHRAQQATGDGDDILDRPAQLDTDDIVTGVDPQ